MSLDECPECGRRINDIDPDGIEAPNGQRSCLRHLCLSPSPREAQYRNWPPFQCLLPRGHECDHLFDRGDGVSWSWPIHPNEVGQRGRR